MNFQGRKFEGKYREYSVIAIILIIILLLAAIFLPDFTGYALPKLRRLSLLKTLTSPDPQVGALFGWSVALSQDAILVRETKNLITGDPLGASIYIYDRKTLALREILKYPNPREGAYNTYPVALGLNTIVVGEHWADVDDKRDAGRVYVYSSENMELKAILSSPNPEAGGFYGWSAVIGSGIIAIGELRGSAYGVRKAGRVYLYDEKTLALRSILTSPEPMEWAGFGAAIALAPNLIIVSEPWAYANDIPNSGKVYVYDFTPLLNAILISPDPQQDAVFGYAVAAGPELVVVGEPKADVGDVRMAGRVHVYRVLLEPIFIHKLKFFAICIILSRYNEEIDKFIPSNFSRTQRFS